MKQKLNRYVMGYSQAYAQWIVAYAPSLEEAQVKYEDGEYFFEDEP